MRYRVLLIILVLSWAGRSLAAQQRRERLARDTEAGAALAGADLVTRLRLTVPPELVLFERRPLRDWAAVWAAATRARLERERRQWLGLRAPGAEGAIEQIAAAAPAAGVRPDTVEYLPPLVRKDTARSGDVLPGVVGQYADLGMRVSGRGELGGEWNRYTPCDPSVHFNCDVSLFPQLRPDMLFGVAVGGTISERVHVNVDYDQRREFDAANNINVYYQGLQDEVLQRVEVGDVSIRLPTSRFLTRGIPAGNFGFLASGQLGPMDFQAVFAQQRGDVTQKEFQLAGGGQQGLVQDAELVLDDGAYVKGQFFYLLDPGRLAGAPWVDVLSLRPQDARAEDRPGAGGTIQLYRDERLSPTSGQQNAQLGYFLAEAVPPGGGLRHSGTFRRLVPEQDYTVHSSGLWIMLRSPLRADEALAVSYITESGDTIGTYNAEQTPPGGKLPELRLLRAPVTQHQPGSGTWPLERHQVYRLDSSSDGEPGDIRRSISLGEAAGGRTFREVNGRQVSFLRLFGLDEDAPSDRLDLAQIWQPGAGGGAQQAGDQQPIGGTYIVFPAIQPFLDPAGITSEGLSAAQVKEALGRDANADIYQEPDPVRRETATRFRLSFQYRLAVQGLVSSFNLGAFGIREESERIRLGERLLERDVDYSIDYDIGQVTLRDPQRRFGANPGAQLRATWEQKPLFEIAPTSVFGLNTRFRLGTIGELNLVGLYQAEKTLMSRPQLGTEPGSIFLGGTSGRIEFGGSLLDRLFGALPGLRLEGRSNIRLSGELALSTPNPNTRGVAYLDDFESSDELRIEPRRQKWQLGSVPQSSLGDRGTLPLAPDASNAAQLVWQHDFLNAEGVAVGARYPRDDIDRQINIAGRQVPEAVLWLNFGSEGEAGGNEPGRWRSITQVLSPTGVVLSRCEYLECYADPGMAGPLAVILDLGVVGEDAFYVDSAGHTTGRYPDNEQWGIGILDEEARLAQREVW
ncbi:MAG: hypothetical protein FIB01_03555, partial [Gemmatimonadetes bacterium]|nr:hypothetical protein [Gemmatimonadota bacterium]